MKTLTPSPLTAHRATADSSDRRPSSEEFCVPQFDSQSLPHALRLEVFVPGVDAHGIDIVIRGTDLYITARKTHFVRPNWQALHLEAAQRDYGLQLRLGSSLDLNLLHAELNDGILQVTIPTSAINRSANPPGTDLAS
jgi:HSP20 family protein